MESEKRGARTLRDRVKMLEQQRDEAWAALEEAVRRLKGMRIGGRGVPLPAPVVQPRTRRRSG